MKNFTILMNRHNISNGDFETLKQAKDRIKTLKGIFVISSFEIIINF